MKFYYTLIWEVLLVSFNSLTAKIISFKLRVWCEELFRDKGKKDLISIMTRRRKVLAVGDCVSIRGKAGCRTCFGGIYTNIGMIQRFAWPLRKDDTQNREAFHIF